MGGQARVFRRVPVFRRERGLSAVDKAERRRGGEAASVAALRSTPRGIQPGGVAVVPKAFHAFNVTIRKTVVAPRVMAQVRTAPVRIVARDTAWTISDLRIAEHPGAEFGWC